MMKLDNDLIEAAVKKQLVIFAGSGLSVKFGLPNWNQMVEDLVTQSNNEVFQTLIPPLKEKLLTPIQVLDKIRLEEEKNILEYVSQKFHLSNPDGLDMSTHEKLLSISEQIITTNFDNAFELLQPTVLPAVYSSKFLTSKLGREGLPFIFKLHGSHTDPENCILFSNQYDELYGVETSGSLKLKSTFSDKTFLFIGFSFSDPDINEILTHVSNLFGNFNKHFILTTEPDCYQQFEFLKCIALPSYDNMNSYLDAVIDRMGQSGTSNEAQENYGSTNKLNVIAKPSRLFTGRSQELEQIDDLFKEEEIFTVTGIGGIGKTQLVLKFLEEHEALKDNRVIWQEVTEGVTIDNFMVATKFESIVSSNKTELEKFNGLIQRLNSGKYVVVFDNFHDRTENSLLRFLEFANNKLGNSRIIIVSRSQSDLNQFAHVNITDFEESLDYARNLSRSRHGLLNLKDSELKRICDYVRGHPLAIELTLNLCEASSLDRVLGKLSRYRSSVEQLSHRLFEEILDQPTTTVSEREFLYNFSIFRGQVPEDLLEDSFGSEVFYDSVISLREKHLIEFEEGNYSTHPLVSEFCYSRLQNKEELHGRVAETLLTQRGKETDPMLEAKVFHHLKGAKQYSVISTNIELFGLIFLKKGLNDFLLEQIEAIEGKFDLKPLHHLLRAKALRAKGEWTLALESYEIGSKQDYDLEVKSECWLHRAEMIRSRGDRSTYNEIIKKTQELVDQTKSKRFQAWIDALLANDRMGEGNFSEAERLFDEALKLTTEVDDKDDLGVCHLNISKLYAREDYRNFNLKLSLKHAEKAKSIFSKDKNMVNVVFSTTTIAACHTHPRAKKPNLSQVKDLLTENLETSLELGHQGGITSCYGALASLYMDRRFNERNLDKALKFATQGLEISENNEDYQRASNYKNDIGIIYSISDFEKQDLRKAEKIFLELIDAAEDDHFYDLSLFNENLSIVYASKGENTKLISCLVHAAAYSYHSNLMNRYREILSRLGGLRNKMPEIEFEANLKKSYDNLDESLQSHNLKSDFFKSPRKKTHDFGRNDWVQVRYLNSDEILTKKFKQIEQDWRDKLCEIISDGQL